MNLDIAKFEERMKTELESVIASLEQTVEATATVEPSQSSSGPVSRIDAIQQQAVAIGLQNRLQLRRRKLEAALGRIASGHYGNCCECQDKLELDRLEADAATVFCLDCASER